MLSPKSLAEDIPYTHNGQKDLWIATSDYSSTKLANTFMFGSVGGPIHQKTYPSIRSTAVDFLPPPPGNEPPDLPTPEAPIPDAACA